MKANRDIYVAEVLHAQAARRTRYGYCLRIEDGTGILRTDISFDRLVGNVEQAALIDYDVITMHNGFPKANTHVGVDGSATPLDDRTLEQLIERTGLDWRGLSSKTFVLESH